MLRYVSFGCFLAMLVLLLPFAEIRAEETGAEDAWKTECDYGITLALGGEIAQAESVFTSLLSHEAGSSRAMTNLGNIQLMRGELDLALSFYDRAFESDTTDGGILLNKAVALMLMGEKDMAQAVASEGIRMAGGSRQASSLLGLPPVEVEERPLRAAERLHVSKEEISSLLSTALKSVPADSTLDTLAVEPEVERKPTQAWRSAGARAAEQTKVGSVLYWKR